VTKNAGIREKHLTIILIMYLLLACNCYRYMKVGYLKEARENRGLKMTPQRIAIIDYLKGNTTHPSALDVYKAVSERFPTMSFTTVYNTLQTLRDKGW
jgi:Fe2+ or Zn2+ uptake regulation protein